MSLRLLLVFALTEFLLSLTPGPAVLLVISQGVRQGLRSSIAGAFGVLTGNAIYFALSAVGLGALLLASVWLFEVIRWIGIAYLVITGVRIIYNAGRRQEAEPEIDEGAQRPQAFAAGLLTQLVNPKAIVFFTALLPQFISTGENVAFQFVVLGLTSVAVEFPVLVLYGYFGDRGRVFITKGKYAPWSERIAGSFLIGAGVSLALARRP
jgi:homoserine/homoserine lactone efflux protein